MDLGFGQKNQILGDATAQALLQSAHVQEQALDDELRRYNTLLDSSSTNDDALEQIRERRLQQWKRSQQQKQKWKQLGHGVYQELMQGQGDTAKAFFEAAKQSERMVVHFYRPTTRHCDVFHAHLESLAQKHLETRFVKINVEDCQQGGTGASFLVERLGIVVLPTLVVIKDRKAVHHLHGFDELGGSPHFATETLAYVLGEHDGLTCRDDEVPPEPTGVVAGVSSVRNIRKSTASKGLRSGLYEEDFDEE